MTPLNLNINPIRQDPPEISTRKAADCAAEFQDWNGFFVNDIYKLDNIKEIHFVGTYLPKGIKVIFKSKLKKPVIFPFSTSLDGFRVLYDNWYLNVCRFTLADDGQNGFYFKIDKPDIKLLNSFEGREIRYADDFIPVFSSLDGKSVAALEDDLFAEEYDFYNEKFVYGIKIDFKKYGQMVFKYGPSINYKLMKEDSSYLYDCWFFVPNDEYIRLVNRLNIISKKTLLE